MADSNKTEKPTSRRRQKARDKGQVARTRDLSGIGAVIAAIVLVGWQGSAMVEAWRGLLKSALEVSVGEVLTPGSSILFWTRWQVVRWIVPSLMGAWIVAAAASVAQGGFVFAPEAMAPNFEKFNPASRLQQMFSITSLSGLMKSLPPAVSIMYLAISSFRTHWSEIVQASNGPPDGRSLNASVRPSGDIEVACWKPCVGASRRSSPVASRRSHICGTGPTSLE